ncbi:hypothetical protein IWW52_000733 [Coemansia sp. RSA 2704]|nr:hypothetical protein IWW54_000834 [Coemansia sp. RSA 2705]KAJ2321461.1 hypothetical protein IWW52_000733 [Coemansia sp. RSA 2704]
MRLIAPELVLMGLLHTVVSRMIYYPPHIETFSGSYIVEFDSSLDNHAHAIHATPGVSVRRRFTRAFNGAVVHARSGINPEHLAGLPGIKRMWPNRRHTLKLRQSKQNYTTPFLHEMTGVARAWRELGINGTGVKLCAVDTGVDWTHPELGNCWGTDGCAWQLGKDCIGDVYGNTDPPEIVPNDTPMDCGGHGTHVSGIMAARGPSVFGVAPGATMGMYRVYSCDTPEGGASTSDDVIMDGMESAHADNCDVINMSIGAMGWSEDPLAAFAAKLVEAGSLIIASAGNDGSHGIHTISSPSDGHGVLSVGSVDNWNVTQMGAVFSLPDGDRSVQISNAASNHVRFLFNKTVPLVLPDDDTGNYYGCESADSDYDGKVVVANNGGCDYTTIAQNVQGQGGVGLIIVNDQEGTFEYGVGEDITIPCISVSNTDGKAIISGLEQGDGTVMATTSTFAAIDSGFDGGRMSNFSAYGPSPELDLVPHLVAPGGNIWSTVLTSDDVYRSSSGTSLSSPYVSGCMALLRQRFTNYTNPQLHQALISAATPLVDTNGLFVNPYRTGAGLVNVYKALQSRTLIDPPYISINQTRMDGKKRTYSQIIKLTNMDANNAANVSLSHSPASSMTLYQNNTYAPLLLTDSLVPIWPPDSNSVTWDTLPQAFLPNSEQRVEAGQTIEFNVTVTAPYGLPESERWYFGGFFNFSVTFDDETQSTHFVCPYAGFNGEYTQIEMLGPKSQGYPSFSDSNGRPIDNVSELTIDPSDDLPTFNYTLDVPSIYSYIALIDRDNKTAGYLPGSDRTRLSRTRPAMNETNSIRVNNTVELDDKTIILGDGEYSLRLALLRPFGNRDDDNDYVYWNSDYFSFGK